MTKEDMKKTYMKPAAEAMNLGLRGEMLEGGISVLSDNATVQSNKIDGGDALVKDGGVWDTDDLWN